MDASSATGSPHAARRVLDQGGRRQKATAGVALALALGTVVAVLATAGGALADSPGASPEICPDCSPPAQCEDTQDNDGDGRVDYPNDPGCTGYADNDETDAGGGGPPPQCSDGADNDGDGRIDYPNDPGCTDQADNDETDAGGGGPPPQCSDGADNDGDRQADGNDPACSSAQDDDESDDPPLENYVGGHDWTYERIDEGEIDATDRQGNPIRCARLGAERSEHGFVAKGWSFKMTLRWCWSGGVVRSVGSWDRWVSNHIPFPVSLIYPLDWKIVSETAPETLVANTSAFSQAKVQICPVKAPTCFTWYPWLRFYFDGQGHAACESDGRQYIPDCRR
jgi:hypothetical protein